MKFAFKSLNKHVRIEIFLELYGLTGVHIWRVLMGVQQCQIKPTCCNDRTISCKLSRRVQVKGECSHNPVEVWDWISDFIPHFIIGVITYPYWDQSLSMLVKGAPGRHICFFLLTYKYLHAAVKQHMLWQVHSSKTLIWSNIVQTWRQWWDVAVSTHESILLTHCPQAKAIWRQ